MAITYKRTGKEPVPLDVYRDGKKVGTIRETGKKMGGYILLGYAYYPIGGKMGEVRRMIDSVQRDIEGAE